MPDDKISSLRKYPKELLEEYLGMVGEIEEVMIIARRKGDTDQHRWEIATVSSEFDAIDWIGLLYHTAHDIEHMPDIN